MSNRELVPTQSASLELKAERAGMQEGYRFLDEKRLILAAEIVAVMADYEQVRRDWQAVARAAGLSLRAAIGRHGLDGLAVYPAAMPPDCAPQRRARQVLGVRLETLEDGVGEWPPAGQGDDGAGAAPAPPPVAQSPEAERCRTDSARLLPLAARMAVLTGNLERLRQEYLRTARRARALEDVLLPEIDETLHAVDTALEELEREEAVRVRRAAG